MPGYPPQGAPPTLLEGDYSDWTSYDTQDDTDVGNPGVYDTFAIFNRLETIALFHHDDFVKTYNITEKTLGSSLLTPYYSTGLEQGQQITTRSAYGTYMVIIDDGQDNIYVLKDGSVAKTITKADLGVAAFLGVSISSKGEYLVIVAANKWIILQGS